MILQGRPIDFIAGTEVKMLVTDIVAAPPA